MDRASRNCLATVVRWPAIARLEGKTQSLLLPARSLSASNTRWLKGTQRRALRDLP